MLTVKCSRLPCELFTLRSDTCMLVPSLPGAAECHVCYMTALCFPEETQTWGWDQACHSCNGILLSHKKEWNNAFCSNMDGPIDVIVLSQRKTMRSLGCGIFKIWYKWTYLQNRNRFTDFQNKFMATKGKVGRRTRLGVWDWQIYTTVYGMVNGDLL